VHKGERRAEHIVITALLMSAATPERRAVPRAMGVPGR
jgi:hypothetical protein